MDGRVSAEELQKGILESISKYWWMILLRGLLAIGFGLIAVTWPDLTLFWFIYLFGFYAIADGVVEIWSGITNRTRHDRWWSEILIGLAGIVAGILVIAWPDVTAVAAMYFLAAWMVVTGVIGIVYALRVRQEISNEWLIIITGVISVMLGIYFFAFPGDGALSLIWVIGIYAIIVGVLLVIFSFRARKGLG